MDTEKDVLLPWVEMCGEIGSGDNDLGLRFLDDVLGVWADKWGDELECMIFPLGRRLLDSVNVAVNS